MPGLPQLASTREPTTTVACHALVVGAFTDDDGVVLSSQARAVDEALEGQLLEYLRESAYKARVGDVSIVPALGRIEARAIAVVGLGEESKLTPGIVRRAAGSASGRLSEHPTIASALPATAGTGDGTGAAAEGLLLGAYGFTAHKSDPKPSKLQRILFLEGDDAVLERAAILSEATWLARDLTNEPASSLTPEGLANKAREVADVAGLDCTIWDEKELGDRGFGGLLGVAAGSERPPRFIQLHYEPDNASRKVALVGKGITYDSGGLSLKDATSMETMKTDMAGAAAVIATMGALGKLKPQVEVLGLVPATENMPGGNAIKPGDVITHYGGRTTEVMNTDAEGRLVLADALAFASEWLPDAIVDVATLTGSIMVALGKKATGLFSNDDALRDELKLAGDSAGERLWPMPLFDDYRKELDSEVADMKNIGSRWGGAIIASLFLKEFVGDGIAWAHLDIAGAARADGDYDEMIKGGTGVPTRTLIGWLEGRSS